MKKLKVFLCVALFGAMSIGAFSAYDYATMSAEEKDLLENVEALTSDESISAHVSCDGQGSVYCPINNKSVYKEVSYVQS